MFRVFFQHFTPSKLFPYNRRYVVEKRGVIVLFFHGFKLFKRAYAF